MAVTVTTAGGADRREFGPVDQYGEQASAFGRAVRSGEPAPTPLADAVANMKVIDAVFTSAASGGWVTL